MTYTDNHLAIANAASVVGAVGVIKVGDEIDLNQFNNGATRIGDDQSLWIRVRCTTQMLTAGTAGTITFHLVSDANASFNNAGSGAPVLAQCTQHGASSLAIVTDDDAALTTGIQAGTATFLPNQSYKQTVTLGTPGQGSGGDDMGMTQTPILEFRLPADTYERYLGVIATIGTAATTAGAVDAHLVTNITNHHHYPNAI